MNSMISFDSMISQRVIFGDNCIEKLVDVITALGCNRVLIVTDPGIEKAGILTRVYSVLNSGKITCFVFSGVVSNPTTQEVEDTVQFAKSKAPIDLIIGLGGGSSMDCAKGANFILTNGGKMEDYWGTNKANEPMLPSIGIPTTTGTGSEAQSYAIIAQKETHIKMACGDKKAQFHTVLLDPVLTDTLPRTVAANTGIDAIAHSIESFVSTRSNPMSQMYSLHAWKMLDSNFEMALNANNRDARGKMLYGAYLAGMAIENSMLGAAHACANPLTSRYGIPHGIAVGIMLPYVIRFNNTVAGQSFHELHPDEDLADRIDVLKQVGDLPNTLHDCFVLHPVKSTDLTMLAEDASKQWTAQFNPRTLGIEDFKRLYEQVI